MTPMTDEMTDVTAGAEAGPVVDVSETPESGAVEVPVDRSEDVQAIAERELKGILESLLFVSPEPLSVQRLLAVIGDVSKAEIVRALQGLGQDLEQEGRGVRLAEIAGGYRLVTKQEYASWIKRLDKAKSAAKLSRSALESLAIIAYKQPIVKSEIEEIRGVETSGVVRTLLERKLVRIVGRKEVPGRPIMYGTTKFFLEHFGLNDLSQLPPLREFKELGESEQSMLPMGEADALVLTDGVQSIEANLQQDGLIELDAVSIEVAEATDPLTAVDDGAGESVELLAETVAIEQEDSSAEGAGGADTLESEEAAATEDSIMAAAQESVTGENGLPDEAVEPTDPSKIEGELVGEPVE
ncbi:SMC-Scp complex subunit ScpB [Nitrospira sp. NS4]|uniref:SMC-Scp complex subunit ScpB n=1 Tax=Nitrospira sp. NS4 TaxID=3414498 RepID=UPI003C2F04D8